MKTPTYLKEVSAEAVANTVAGAVRLTQETLRELPRVVISAEERLRQKVNSALRLIVAALFFLIGNVVSLGINVSLALAKKGGTEQTREKRSKGQQKSKLKLKALSHLHDRKPVAKASRAKVHKQVGKASWYGKPFHNRKTASGKRYNMYAPMAAHRTLPFGTLCKVTNLSNGKTCIVEIADRGPYVGNRIIDLSYAAANELDFASNGIANVQLDVISNVEPEFNFAEHIRQPKPQFDEMPLFPQRKLLELRDLRSSEPMVMNGREN
ncbi:MAG TPA: septal ring lytic transglycosylase RlpA family protein [Candidatus Kapabacteria bacterium]|nr:septal ring lytic transglycosylase RlpA family protein [Candidatus Kapabacteria bacterium]